MIYPTARAVVRAAAGAPVALLLGLVAPGWWVAGGAWIALLAALILIDALIGPGRGAVHASLETPAAIGTGSVGELALRVVFDGVAPRRAEFSLDCPARLSISPSRGVLTFSGSQASTRAELIPLRRGEAEITALWLRWRGGLGLVWKQWRETPERTVAVLPDVSGVKAQAIRLYGREAPAGMKSQLETGEGSEFHALREAPAAIDPRAIDWKQSARHGRLLAKEFRVERNHPIVFAIDTGRAMGEPLEGAPRLDRAINAALLLAYVCLKTGDMAAVFGFGARPRAFSGFVSGAGNLRRLQTQLAGLDYGEDETNYTLGLTQLGASLKRRSLIVVFTEFADTTSAELMIENLTRLLRRHLVLFVALRDSDLERLTQAEPRDAETVSRAVTAHALLRARDLVIARLARLGVRIVDAPAERLGPALISAYLDLKRSDAL